MFAERPASFGSGYAFGPSDCAAVTGHSLAIGNLLRSKLARPRAGRFRVQPHAGNMCASRDVPCIPAATACDVR
jgi:hypothetical protein